MAPKAAAKPAAGKKEKAAPGEKKLSAYNLFIQTELKRLKEADKSLSHQAAFKQATVNWSKNKPAK